MARTDLMRRLKRLVHSAHHGEPRITRRRFLAGAAALGAVPMLSGFSFQDASSIDVGIVGAGLAGLACADALKQKGIRAAVYEGRSRVGGRQSSLSGFFPGQVVERGGELIDNLHKTLLGYAQRFKLAKEDVGKVEGEAFFYFHGRRYPEEQVVEEYREFVDRMRDDLRTLSGAPTADAHNDADVALDRMSLEEYLDKRRAGPVLRAAVEASYIGEYGLELDRQSSLNFLLFIHADRRSRFQPFGVFSDERYHIIDGNDRIARGLADAVDGQIELGMRLVRICKTPSGRIELTFQQDSRTIARTHDVVVLAVPFTTLRGVELDAGLGLPEWKLDAIRNLGYGTNSKLMVGFTSRPWAAQGGDGSCYADLPNLHGTWETNPERATSSQAVLTDYTGGNLGTSLDPNQTQKAAEAFLIDADKVFPGVKTAARRDSRKRLVAHLEAWPQDPWTRGSYTCYLPGQFTTIAGNEGKPAGNLYFAGEHANSFYEWQGFMEGAALSGLQTASEILRRARR